MHYLVVAKVEDYPNFNELENSLMYIEPASSDRWGDWEEIAANVEEFTYKQINCRSAFKSKTVLFCNIWQHINQQFNLLYILFNH